MHLEEGQVHLLRGPALSDYKQFRDNMFRKNVGEIKFKTKGFRHAEEI